MFENYANIDSPITKETWRKLSEFERLELVKDRISASKDFHVIYPTGAKKYGQVTIITLCENLNEVLKKDPKIEKVIYLNKYYITL